MKLIGHGQAIRTRTKTLETSAKAWKALETLTNSQRAQSIKRRMQLHRPSIYPQKQEWVIVYKHNSVTWRQPITFMTEMGQAPSECGRPPQEGKCRSETEQFHCNARLFSPTTYLLGSAESKRPGIFSTAPKSTKEWDAICPQPSRNESAKRACTARSPSPTFGVSPVAAMRSMVDEARIRGCRTLVPSEVKTCRRNVVWKFGRSSCCP